MAAASEHYSGSIYFDDHGRISKLDLNSEPHYSLKKSEFGYAGLHMRAIHLSKIDDKRIVFDISEKAMESGKIKRSIYMLDLRNNRAEFLRDGHTPTYMPQLGVLFYFENVFDARIGRKVEKLFFTHLADVTRSSVEVLLPNRDAEVLPEPVIQVSPTEVLFRVEQPGTSSLIWLYNPTTQLVAILPITDCYPGAWRSKTKQLLCTSGEYSPRRHFLTDLNFERVEYGMMPQSLGPMHYIEKFDSLVANSEYVEKGGAVFDLVMFNFTDRSIRMLHKKGGGSNGSAVWVGGE